MKNRGFALAAAAFAGALFGGMQLLLEVGRQLGERDIAVHGAGARAGVGIVDGAVFGLLGLLVAFSFSGAATRFDNRRGLVAQQVTAMGVAWQRLDLLPLERRDALRSGFRRYLDALLVEYSSPTDRAAAYRENATVRSARETLWAEAVAVCLTPSGDAARMLLLPALNEVFSAVERERLARRIHPPRVIYAMLTLTALATALFAGYGMANVPTRNWVYIIGVAGTISIAVYVVLELEYPRRGLIRLDAMDQALVDLRTTMG